MIEKLSAFKNNKGWILADAIIGMLVLTIGICAVTLAFTQATKTSTFSSAHSQATYIAQTSLEYLKKYDGTSATAPFDANTDTGLPAVPAGFERTLTQTNNYNGATHVTLVVATVAWTDKNTGKKDSVTLNSFYYLQ